MDKQQTYTQVQDDDGTIKYVPTNPPTPPPGGGDSPSDDAQDPREDEVRKYYSQLDFEIDNSLTSELQNLLVNSKRLRYNRRLQAGKLDGRRLSAYRTSDRLFKKKAINAKNYQFTFLMDTSGSMLSKDDGEYRCKLELASDAVAKTVKSLEAINMRSSIFSMNQAFELIKDFETPLDDTKFANDIVRTSAGMFMRDNGSEIDKMGGTFEWVAYEQTMKYLSANSPAGITNVVIVLSDGEPGGSGSQCQVTIDGKTELVDSQGYKDSASTLATFWDRQYPTLAFGIGIRSKARQVPNNKQIDDITKLPSVLSNLLTELML